MATNGTAIEDDGLLRDARQADPQLHRTAGMGRYESAATRHHPLPILMFMADWREQVDAWACESLYTALATSDPVLAFRAFAQAVEYFTRMRYEYRLPVAALGDSLGVARNRIEELLRREQ